MAFRIPRPRLVVIGTRNAGKRAELAAGLAGLGFEVRGLEGFPAAGEVAEEGVTFLENARRKAVTWAERTEEWVLADDSGLEVDALGGRPGVLSARYAGAGADAAANNAKLLAELAGVPPAKRTARFRCALVLAAPRAGFVFVEAVCEGVIAEAPRGRRGFGYDPIFYFPAYGRTFGEVSAAEKAAVSHRGRALAELRRRWETFFRR